MPTTIHYDPATKTYTDRPGEHGSGMRANLPDPIAKGPGTVFKTVATSW